MTGLGRRGVSERTVRVHRHRTLARRGSAVTQRIRVGIGHIDRTSHPAVGIRRTRRRRTGRGDVGRSHRHRHRHHHRPAVPIGHRDRERIGQGRTRRTVGGRGMTGLGRRGVSERTIWVHRHRTLARRGAGERQRIGVRVGDLSRPGDLTVGVGGVDGDTARRRVVGCDRGRSGEASGPVGVEGLRQTEALARGVGGHHQGDGLPGGEVRIDLRAKPLGPAASTGRHHNSSRTSAVGVVVEDDGVCTGAGRVELAVEQDHHGVRRRTGLAEDVVTGFVGGEVGGDVVTSRPAGRTELAEPGQAPARDRERALGNRSRVTQDDGLHPARADGGCRHRYCSPSCRSTGHSAHQQQRSFGEPLGQHQIGHQLSQR